MRPVGHIPTAKYRKVMADTFAAFQNGTFEDIKGFCFVATLQDIAKQDYILTPKLSSMFAKSHELEEIKKS